MRKPGMLAFNKIEAAALTRSDSLEGLLKQPLIVSSTYNSAYGTPRRGSLVSYDEASNLCTPIIAADVAAVLGAGSYSVVRYGDVAVGDTVTVANADGSEAVSATVTSLDIVLNTLTVDFGAETEPSAPALVIYDGQEAAEAAGVVYESTLDTDFALAVEAWGIRPEKVAGGATSFALARLGSAKRISGLLFVSVG